MTKKKTNISADYNIYQHIKATMVCIDSVAELAINEDALIMLDVTRENCGVMSPESQMDDMQEANKKILNYIDSIKDKQRVITPSQISKKLGMSKTFIENMLIMNGFQED